MPARPTPERRRGIGPLLILLILGVGVTVAGCAGGGFAQPVPSYGARGGGNWMAGGGG